MNKILKMLWITLFIGISSTALAGPNADVGTVIGGIAGGLVGNSIGHGSDRAAATIGGAVIGSLVGNQMGTNVDRQEYGRPCRYYNRVAVYPHNYYRPYPYYRYNYVYRDGRRFYRRNVVINANGNRVFRTYSYYRVPPHHYYHPRVRVYY